MRTEFGYERTVCSCEDCKRNCEVIPGYLVPSDLERMIPKDVDTFHWAAGHLLASPGAVVMKDGRIFNIPTLVPAFKADGSCVFYQQGKCDIHSVAPFGCAYFDVHQPAQLGQQMSSRGLREVMIAQTDPNSLYKRLWDFLYGLGKVSPSAAEKRARFKK